MILSFSALRCREVINISDGRRLGYVSDLELETESGRIIAVYVPCRDRFFRLFSSANYVIPWHCIRKIGEDLILVESCLEDVRRQKEKRSFFS